MKKRQRKKGFGILEVLLATVIISLILGALVAVGRTSMKSNEFYLQRMQATYLAQQNIEIARQIRDTNWIDKSSLTQWDTFDTINNTSIFDASDKVGYFTYNVNATDPALSRYSWVLHPAGASINSGTTYCDANPAAPVDICEMINNVKYQKSVEFSPVDTLLKPDTNGTDTPIINSGTLHNAVKVISHVSWQNSGRTVSSVDVSEILTNWRPNF